MTTASAKLTAKVVNLHKEPFDFYIGRTGQGEIGTPGIYKDDCYTTETHGGRNGAIRAWKEEKFLPTVVTDLLTHLIVVGLNQLRLGCFCKPKSCHGDVIVEWMEAHDSSSCPKCLLDLKNVHALFSSLYICQMISYCKSRVASATRDPERRLFLDLGHRFALKFKER